MRIDELQPNSRFALDGMRETTGILLSVNPSRAHVRYDRPAKRVAFEDRNGTLRYFVAHGGLETDISPATRIVPIIAGN
jgi:hypothetical protein